MDGRVHVAAGGDRFQEWRQAFGSRGIDLKVSSLDAKRDLFIIELTDNRKGGPQRQMTGPPLPVE